MWYTVTRHADPPKNWSPKSCQMQILLACLSLRQEVDPLYPTTCRQCLCRCRFDNPQSQQGTPVQNRCLPEWANVLGGTEYIWKYPGSIIFRSYVSHLWSNYHHQAQNRVQRGAFAGPQLIGRIWFERCPVHTRDVDLSRFLFASYIIQHAESHLQTKMDAMDSLILYTFDACWTILFLCHTQSPPHFPLQLPIYKRLSLFDEGYRWDQANECL